MYGIMCCGDEPSNQFEEICCDNVPRRRKQSSSFIDRCCGNQTLAYDQTCCQGVVHNIPSGECCGKMAYARNSFNTLCCDEMLLTNVDPSLICCGKPIAVVLSTKIDIQAKMPMMEEKKKFVVEDKFLSKNYLMDVVIFM
ncbi:unnamed protein product [Meloidogyne enterolobii]|uniref:Uncharacterized protein n=1 Tax=Meloidogyne enterolobii TaxID=390850 RepID=A0ACB0YCJ0_MELEN